LLPAEQRCQTYLALIHGSKGIFYFRYPIIYQPMFDMLAQLAREMKVLGPICLTPEIAQETRYTPGVLDPIARKFTDVQVSLRHNPAGGYVLLCANTVYYPVDTTFTVALLGNKGEVSRLFSDQTYAVSNSSFSDRIEGFGTRAYAIQMQNAGCSIKQAVIKWWQRADSIRGQRSEVRNQQSEIENRESKISIAVAMQPHPELATAEPSADAELKRTGKKNKLPNSSFEQATVPGWPDYYRYVGSAIMPDERIGGPAPVWGVDTNQPYHGSFCLYMSSAGVKNHRQTCIEYEMDPALTPQARPFVLSTWMRGNRDGVAVELYVDSAGGKTVSLTTKWQRYVLPLTLPAKTGHLVIRWDLHPVQAGATVWMDAVQLEPGDKPTDYEP